MKKHLLLGALLLGSLFTVSAQVTSFEASEGFEVGPVSGQEGWNVSTGTGVDGNLFTISAADASNGTQSLLITGGNGATGNHGLRGAFSPEFAVGGDMLYFSFDIKTSAFSANGSDFYISPQSPSQEMLTSRIVFSYDGQVGVLDTNPTDPTALAIVPIPDFEYEGETWYNVMIVQDNTAETIQYYIDGELLYTGDAFGATNIEQIVILNDNYEGFAYIDNMSVTNVLSRNNAVLASQFSVFPNPTTGIINVANADALVNNVAIVDINGRTVKTANFAGVSEASVNISDLASGVYMMTISSDKGTTTKKIVKN